MISINATAFHDEKEAYRHREGGISTPGRGHIGTREGRPPPRVLDTERGSGSISTPGQSQSAGLTYDDQMATTKQNKGLPRQPLIVQYYVNLSANFLKHPLNEPLSVKDETTLNVFYGKYKFISQGRASYDHRPS